MHVVQVKFLDNFRLEFMQRCAEKLASFGDAAADAQRYDDAITQYSAALHLNPPFPQQILTKRSKAYVKKGLWEDALNDTNEVCHFCLMQI